MEQVNVELLQDGSRAREGVDDRLLKLAKQHGAVIMTLDYNLNKVAAVEGTEVLNLNELAQSIRMEHLPGEKITLEIIQKGQDAHQGVGYLSDGTMVVVDQANSQIGQTLDVEIVRNLQTAAGRMIFAKKIDTAGKTAKSASNSANNTQKSAKIVASAKASAKTKTASAKQRSAGRARSQSPSTSSRDSAKKSNETRVQVAPKQSRRTNSPKAKSQPKPAADSLRRQNNRRRADHESDLIDLVNNQ
mgnify:FL=1